MEKINYGPHWAQPEYVIYNGRTIYFLNGCNCKKYWKTSRQAWDAAVLEEILQMWDFFYDEDGQPKVYHEDLNSIHHDGCHVVNVTNELPWPIKSPLAELLDRQTPRK